MMRAFLFANIFLFTTIGIAKPACSNLRLILNPSNYTTGSTNTAAFTARVQADTSSGGCNYFITFDYGTASNFNSRSLKYGIYSWPYQLAKDSSGTQVLKSLPDASSCADIICDSLANGSNSISKDSSYQFIIESTNQWRKFGSYSDNYTLRLYKGTLSSYSLSDQATMNVNFQAAKKADISLVNSGANFDLVDTTQNMNFGNINSGSTLSADMILKYNAGCTVLASSANNGSLKHSSLSQFISYTLSLNGNSVGLGGSSGSPVPILVNSGVSPANGNINHLTVTVGNPAGKSPGNYSDTVTFTVQSNE